MQIVVVASCFQPAVNNTALWPLCVYCPIRLLDGRRLPHRHRQQLASCKIIKLGN